MCSMSVEAEEISASSNISGCCKKFFCDLNRALHQQTTEGLSVCTQQPAWELSGEESWFMVNIQQVDQ